VTWYTIPTVRKTFTSVFRFLLGLAGIAIFGWQCVVWLKTSTWHGLPVSMLVKPSSDFGRWFTDPHSWFGLHKLIVIAFDLPLSLILLWAALLDGLWREEESQPSGRKAKETEASTEP
jgi:hypothetical protein